MLSTTAGTPPLIPPRATTGIPTGIPTGPPTGIPPSPPPKEKFEYKDKDEKVLQYRYSKNSNIPLFNDEGKNTTSENTVDLTRRIFKYFNSRKSDTNIDAISKLYKAYIDTNIVDLTNLNQQYLKVLEDDNYVKEIANSIEQEKTNKVVILKQKLYLYDSGKYVRNIIDSGIFTNPENKTKIQNVYDAFFTNNNVKIKLDELLTSTKSSLTSSLNISLVVFINGSGIVNWGL